MNEQELVDYVTSYYRQVQTMIEVLTTVMETYPEFYNPKLLEDAIEYQKIILGVEV